MLSKYKSLSINIKSSRVCRLLIVKKEDKHKVKSVNAYYNLKRGCLFSNAVVVSRKSQFI